MLACQCFIASVKTKKLGKSLPIEGLDHQKELEEVCGKFVEQLISMPLREEDPSKVI